jgi:hypothetical protein
MKKTGLVIAAAFIICIALAAGGIFLTQSSKNAPSTTKPTVTNQQPKTGETTTLKGSILSLLSGNKTVQCTIAYPNNGGSGTVYVSGKKFSGEFTMRDASGKETVGHAISDGTYTYVWSSAASMGIKMKLDQSINAASQSNQNVNINQDVNLNCSPWIANESKFQVPSNINFTDMSNFAVPTTKVTGTTGGTTNAQSVCNQITDPTAKAACLNALNSSH